MGRRIKTLAILCCLVMSATAFIGFDDDDKSDGDGDDNGFADYTNDENGNGDKVGEDESDEESHQASQNSSDSSSNQTWFCPQGWTPFSDENHVTCIWLSNVSLNFNDALTHCQSLSGSLVSITSPKKDAFVKAAVFKKERDFWIGLSKGRGYDTYFQWHTKLGTVYADVSKLPEQIREYLSYKGQCITISTYSEEWEMDDCESEYRFVCEREIECVPGTFGPQCEQECHCAGEPCAWEDFYNSWGVFCKWGCQRNWMGQACDKKKEDPEVKYFCINSPEEDGTYVYIRIYTKGVAYKSINGLNGDKSHGQWCNGTKTTSSNDRNELTTITIPVNNNTLEQMDKGECVGEHVEPNTFSWAIAIQENDGILLEHDLQVFITCDFNNADKLIRSDEYATQGEPAHVHQSSINPESIVQDVLLEVVNAYTGLPVNEAAIGTTVVLKMKYGLKKDSVLKGVVPYNCVASSPNGKVKKQLLDKNGCQVMNSPVKPFYREEQDIIQTPWFNLFGFENEQNVVFRCSFGLCFEFGCKVGCREDYSLRKRREAQEETRDVQHSTTRTIRVLPSISPNRGSEPKPVSTGDNHKSGIQPASVSGSASSDFQWTPFVYLNPVTCGLFLLLLLVFLCMYIAFLRTLRSSINDVRKEIEIKRSRDKFLNCGCPTQQKDRAYVGC